MGKSRSLRLIYIYAVSARCPKTSPSFHALAALSPAAQALAEIHGDRSTLPFRAATAG
jgi:hypothetical protein